MGVTVGSSSPLRPTAVRAAPRRFPSLDPLSVRDRSPARQYIDRVTINRCLDPLTSGLSRLTAQ
jgi:hypothetical protein